MLRSCVSALARLGFVGAFAFAATLVPHAAGAADIYPGDDHPGGYGRYQRYEPAPYPREALGPRFARPPAPVGEAEGYCRIRHRRGVDEYGREVIRRVRICDEGVVAERPAYEPRPRYGYEPPPRAWSRPLPVDPDDEDED